MATSSVNGLHVSTDGIAIAIAGGLRALLIQGGLLGALDNADLVIAINVASRAALGDLAQEAMHSGRKD